MPLLPVDNSPAPSVQNASWTTADVHGQYSGGNSHADLYLLLSRFSDMDTYLNVGYSRFGQRHLHVKTHLRLIDRLADGLLALHAASPYAKVESERRLLDVASGRGGAAIRAQQKYGLDVVGVDFTRHNVAKARANAHVKGAVPGVQFVLGDAHALPIASRSVSLAWSIESPAHFADKPLFLRELSRVVKPGGAACFADLLVVDRVAMASVNNLQIYRDFLNVWDVPYLETVDSYRKAIAEAGFELHRVEIVTRYNLDILRRHCRWFLALSHFPALYQYHKRAAFRANGANLDHAHDHILRSFRALRLGMIDYGLFWMTRR